MMVSRPGCGEGLVGEEGGDGEGDDQRADDLSVDVVDLEDEGAGRADDERGDAGEERGCHGGAEAVGVLGVFDGGLDEEGDDPQHEHEGDGDEGDREEARGERVTPAGDEEHEADGDGEVDAGVHEHGLRERGFGGGQLGAVLAA